MAEAEDPLYQDQFSCPICLDLLKDPVTIPCGHSYCMGCIKGCWDQDDQNGVYNCRQCRQTFSPRPVLGKNILIAEMMENLMKTGLQSAPSTNSYTVPERVECDFCIREKQQAVKSCLQCLVSYCETHLQPHYESPGFKKHKLIKASTQLEEKICSHHDKLLEVYCHTDQQCICYQCVMEEHKGHNTVPAAAEWTEKQEELLMTQRKSQKRIQERGMELQELRKAVESLRLSAQAAVEDSERIFTELICSIERMRSEVKELIRAQEKAELSQTEGLLEQLEQEIAELRRRDTQLEQLTYIEDHIHFLQSFQSLCVPPGSEVLPSITVNPHFSFGNVKKSVSELKERLEDFSKQEIDKISEQVTKVLIVLPLRPKTREEFLQYSCQLTLDRNTTNNYLHLSERNRKVTYSNPVKPYPNHPERFDAYAHVLCREHLSGCCYWEAEWSGEDVSIAVSYKGISRKGKGDECRFGFNDQSWRLHCSPSRSYFRHSDNQTEIPVPMSSRIGVYLDHRAGNLSFYSVCDTMALLHRVQTTFTQPLYPGLGAGRGSSVEISGLKTH